MPDPGATTTPQNVQKGKSVFLMECPTVPTLHGSEVRFSIRDPKQVKPIFDWPLAYVACAEITPNQRRSQWGVSTTGARLDSYKGLRLGSSRNNLTLGYRSTDASSIGSLAPVENQRVGVASVTLGGRVRFQYWNDHKFWWWPMGDGGDQGDTAGVQFSYNLGAHDLNAGSWKFEQMNLTLRLASGIPDRGSAVPMGSGEVYTLVDFPEVDRGDIDVSTTLSHPKGYRLDVGFTVNSGVVRHKVQSDLVHKSGGIPEFPETDHFGAMLYLRLTSF